MLSSEGSSGDNASAFQIPKGRFSRNTIDNIARQPSRPKVRAKGFPCTLHCLTLPRQGEGALPQCMYLGRFQEYDLLGIGCSLLLCQHFLVRLDL